MSFLGIRCSNSDYTYAVLDGDKAQPLLSAAQQVSFPVGYEEHEQLRWFGQEMRSLFKTYGIEAVAVKRAETNVKRSNALELRIANEALVLLVASESGCSNISRKVSSTIAKDLGLKGKGRYLQTKLDTSPVTDFDGYSRKQQEAILAAWSCMS